MKRLFAGLLALAVSVPALAADFRLVSREGRIAEYEGSVTLSGRVERRQDDETLVWRGDRVCFAPDAASTARLPPAPGKAGARLFCFSNNRSAADLLKMPATPPAGACGVAGAATVVVSRYTVESGENVFDQAWLERVEKLAPLAPLACP